MSLCSSCGLIAWGDVALCLHHHCITGDDWAASNRIWCDVLHRGKLPPRLTEAERDDNFWTARASGAA